MKEESPKNSNILLAGMIAAYGVIVCSLLQTLPLWVDEILQLSATMGRSFPQTLYPYPGHPGTAPLAYFVQSLFVNVLFVNVLGSSVFWARFPAAAFSVLSCAGIVWLARQLRFRDTAVAVILFMTVPLQFRYALEGRCYSQALFFAVLATNAVLQLARRPSPFWAGLYGMAVLLGVYSFPLTVFVPLGHLVWIAGCPDNPERKRALIWAGGAAACAGLLFAPWYWWARGLWLEAIVTQQLHFVLTWKTPFMLLREMAGGGYWISVPLLAAAGLGVASRRMSGSVKTLLVSSIAAPVLGALTADAAFDYFLAIRQMIFILPGLVLLAAEGLRELYERRRSAGTVLFAGILASAVTHDVRRLARPSENWQMAASVLKASARDACILFVPTGSMVLYAYFEPELESRVCDSKQPVPPSRRIIVAIPYGTPQADTKPILDRLRAAGMVLAERKAAGGTRMLLYERPLIPVPLAEMAQGTCAISGRVADDTGKPVPSAVVQALRERFLSDELVVAGSLVNQRGEYCLRDLAAGEYVVRATARMQPPAASPRCDSCCGPTTEFEATFYRASRAPGSASPVSIGRGQNPSGVDIRMRRVPAYCVRGEVRDTMGSLASRVAIGVEQGSWSSGVINEGGRFLLTDLPSGSYTIVVGDRGGLGARVLAQQVVKVGAANIDGVVITIGASSPAR